jgi:hypothetical protein
MSPSTRALLAAAREGLGPDPAAAARVRARLDALLAAPAAAAPAAAAAGGGGLALKLAAAAALATATAAIVIAVPTTRTEPTAARAPALDDAVEQPALAVHATAVTVDDVVAPPVRPVRRERPAPTPVAAPVVAPVAEVSLAREVELIDDAMASLRAGHATEALAAIAAYHRETADRGQLTEEASAIDIEARCTLHLDVRDKLTAFDRSWPSSAQRARLTAACTK